MRFGVAEGLEGTPVAVAVPLEVDLVVALLFLAAAGGFGFLLNSSVKRTHEREIPV